MPKTTRKQVGFYATPEVQQLLREIPSSLKSRFINDAICAVHLGHVARPDLNARMDSIEMRFESLLKELRARQKVLIDV